MALTQQLALDAVLCVGMLIAGVSGAIRVPEVFGLVAAGGVGKTVVAGVVAYVRCRLSEARRPPRRPRGGLTPRR